MSEENRPVIKDKPWVRINENPPIRAQEHHDGVLLCIEEGEIHFAAGMRLYLVERKIEKQVKTDEGEKTAVETWYEYDLASRSNTIPGHMSLNTFRQMFPEKAEEEQKDGE